MAKKKRAVKRRAARRNPRRARAQRSQTSNVKNRISLVINNLLLFIALSLVSLVLYRYIQSDLFNQLFFVMATAFGFVSVAFLIALIILYIIKAVSKK